MLQIAQNPTKWKIKSLPSTVSQILLPKGDTMYLFRCFLFLWKYLKYVYSNLFLNEDEVSFILFCNLLIGLIIYVCVCLYIYTYTHLYLHLHIYLLFISVMCVYTYIWIFINICIFHSENMALFTCHKPYWCKYFPFFAVSIVCICAFVF